ncbi:hypothetical protein D1647_13675 [Alistipes sp. Z76]|jgi:hypothetical protein|uniref:hypothetical protein n=1 Tax=Xylanibacter rodentium TaxID=2736289 RepID=UPI00136A89EB|nr:hypothetical protein [Xylanibacter rodentium]NBJ07213.1 hypothetical protein [Alistipes sp. Z76]NCE69313.1 hypothetical protein [Muribaculaceae bacterium M3]
MANKISYLYTAHDKKSFDFFAADAVKCGAIVTIDPEKQTILLTTTEDKMTGTSDDPVYSLREIIHANELNVVANLIVADPDPIKEIADLTKKNEALKADRDRYAKWHSEAYAREDRIKKQVAAIAVLVDAIGQ